MDSRKWFILLTGLAVGAIAAILVKLGNPANMGFCIACFERDIAGAIGLHRAGIVQYMRPEIIGLILGAMLTSMFAGEFKTRGGSATFVRFIMGVFMMIGALVFLGCPLRDILRMAGGDFNAVVALIGFICGVGAGVFFLKKGFNLGRAEFSHSNAGGYLLPIIFVFFLFLLIKGTVFNPDAGGPLFFSTEGPGSMAAPLGIALLAGLVVGFLAQRTRLCLSGGIRDFILIKDNYLLLGFIGIFIGALILNIIFGFFKPGFADQPVAHTMQVWNFLGLFLVGLTATLLGGCPLRQLILSGEGDMDAASVVAGMTVGAAFCHNFMLAGSPAGVGIYGQIACVVGIILMGWIGWSFRED
ncbi:MAG: YedE family putative selenium transporter [Syntrophomonadaceae bacterium]|nr:YedE family putative selenium transporter [Syntrophomonadaceae bacterium]MDD3889403.1 YedE family putative selenium transporter [Syntrophomonadaceae bacterium]MDD4549523.1 YedE family putative selenium transporter [Syntrophomonadaceae bacterium]